MLEEEAVDQIKQHILGAPVKEVEIVRIKPTIIRRRRKKVKLEPIQLDVSVEKEVQAEAAEVAEKPITIGRDGCAVRAINFAGGGFDSIMQLGVIHALLVIQGRAPDVVVGLSSGSVPAAALA
ncbi:MAG: patatin-like phospholipase family protein, partial [Acidobacteria bacterium]|nr:patatin-like phospholipase family protein [Candidatus Sulfomarinibacter sp. MAG AM2]